MKTILSIFLSCLAYVCNAQEYTVSWNIADSDHPNISDSKSDDPDKRLDRVDVLPSKKVVLDIIIPKDNVQEIKYEATSDSDKPETVMISKDKLDIQDAGTVIHLLMEVKGNGIMQIHNETRQLAYPYQITYVPADGKEKVLVLGDAKHAKSEQPVDLHAEKINVLKGLQTDVSKKTFDYCAMMEDANVLILLDCSTRKSAKSKVYRQSCKEGTCEECKQKTIRVGDYVKVYLDNFNPYLYSAKMEDRQIDAEFGGNFDLFKKPEDDKKGGADASVGVVGSVPVSALLQLEHYAQANLQMRAFIDLTKHNTQPDHELLETNKGIIIINLADYRLTVDENIDSLYNLLDDATRAAKENTYKQAQQFAATRAELLLLSYLAEATIVPIKVRSFDKLEFTITLKNLKTNETYPPRLFQYLIRGGLKVDQSYGVVLHGLWNQEFGLHSFTVPDTMYARYPNGGIITVTRPDSTVVDSIQSITDQAKREILDESSPNKIALGASTLTHLYWRTCIGGTKIRVGFGPEVGLGADIYPETNIRYLLGGGILFYDGQHRISLDAGCAFGKYKAFGNGQGIGTILTGADAQPSLVEKSGRSWYIGVSYNVPLIKKDTQTE